MQAKEAVVKEPMHFNTKTATLARISVQWLGQIVIYLIKKTFDSMNGDLN